METNHLTAIDHLPIKEQIQMLVKVREDIKSKEEILEEAKENKRILSDAIMASLKAIGTRSFKDEAHSVSISSSRRVVIVDEGSVIKYLKSKRLAKEYVEKIERLNEFAPKAVETLINNGVHVDGTEIKESEWVSVRSVPQKGLVSPEDELKSFKARVAKERGN